MPEQQDLFDGLTPVRQPIDQDLVTNEEPVLSAIAHQMYARCEAVRMEMVGDVTDRLAEGIGVFHHHADRTEHSPAALQAREAHTEIRTVQFRRGMLKQGDPGPIAETWPRFDDDVGLDPESPHHGFRVAVQLLHQFRKEAQQVGVDKVETRSFVSLRDATNLTFTGSPASHVAA